MAPEEPQPSQDSLHPWSLLAAQSQLWSFSQFAAWSDEYLWRFCSVQCCLLCQNHPEAPPKATSAHLWCLQSRHPLQKHYSKVQSETQTEQRSAETLGRSECLILAHFSENFLYRREAQLQKGTPGTCSQGKEPECQRWKMNFPKMASCNDGRRAFKYPKSIIQNSPSHFIKPLWTQGNWFWWCLQAKITPKPNWTLELR